MNCLKLFLWIVFFCCFLWEGMAQKWKYSQGEEGDTLVQIQTYVDLEGQGIEDSTQTHKIVSKYKDYYLLSWERFRLDGTAAADRRGVHKKVIFLKRFFKFYDIHGQSLLEVRDPYYYEQGDATYCIYKYNKHSDLLEVCFYKDEVVIDQYTGKETRSRLKAVEAYNSMVHRYHFKYFWNRKILKEYSYSINDRFIEKKVFVRKRIRVGAKKKRKRS